MRTILWDMDGTIADTEHLHFRAWQVVASGYGVEYTFDQFLAGFGRRNGDILSELLDEDPDSEMVQEVANTKEATFRSLLQEYDLQPLPGVMKWLHTFRDCGVHQVVSSSGPMANIAAMVDVLEIGDFFLALMSGATLPKSKPDPTIFLNSAAAVATTAQECVVVEDSIHGIEAARRAGMASVAVGKLAASSELEELLCLATGPKCISVGTLEELTWQSCERLWQAVQRQ